MALTEASKFGNGVAVGSGGNVSDKGTPHNVFGPRDSGGTLGRVKTEGITEELRIHITGELFNDVPDGLVPPIIPAGAVIKAVYVNVEEVFVVTGTNPTILVGTNGSEVTNGLVISEAVAEALGPANLTSTLAGTWDAEAPLAADTTVGIALGGTNTPAITDVGKLLLTIVYDRAALGL